jgi:hypothetical protein
MRSLLAGLLLIVALVLPASAHAATAMRQAKVGDYATAFTAQYGKPVATKTVPYGRYNEYQHCSDKTPRLYVMFVHEVSAAIVVSTCGAPIPTNWRDRLKSFLPTDSVFMTAKQYQGRVQYFYKSARIAEQVPGALCAGSDQYDGLLLLQSNAKGSYALAVVSLTDCGT